MNMPERPAPDRQAFNRPKYLLLATTGWRGDCRVDGEGRIITSIGSYVS